MLLTHQSDEVESEEGDVEGDGYHDGDGDDDDEELSRLFCCLVALQKLTVDSLAPVLAEEVQPWVSCWRLPSELSQGLYEGCNASYA